MRSGRCCDVPPSLSPRDSDLACLIHTRVEEFDQTRAGGGLAAVAREMSTSITDPDIQATEVRMC